MDKSAMIEHAKKLFKAWHSDTALEAPAQLVTSDFHLHDTALDTHAHGWEAVCELTQSGIDAGTEWDIQPVDFWTCDDSDLLAVRWQMVGKLKTGETFDIPGMSALRFRDGMVCEEIDYYRPIGMHA